MNKPWNQALVGIAVMLLFFLAGCQTQHARHGTAYSEIMQSVQQAQIQDSRVLPTAQPVPEMVSDALLQPVKTGLRESTASKRFNVSADAIPARQFFMGLVEGTPVNMMVNPEVTGNVTVHLKNVTIDEAIQAVHDVYGYSFRKTALGYEIMPRKMETAIFSVNYLDVARNGKSIVELSTGQISEKISGTSTGSSTQTPSQGSTTTTTQPSGSSVDTRSVMNFWKQLSSALRTMVGTESGRSVIVNGESGIVMVHAYPDELMAVGYFLDRIQSHMGRQVIIEAKILEVQLNDQFQSGIDWNMFGNEKGLFQTGTETFGNTNLKDFASIFTLDAGKGRFNLLIKLLQTQGNVQVISSPRISTVNNQKAVIKVGTDQFYVTGVSTDNTVTATSTIPTQNVSLTPFFSGVTFDVTPEISGDDVIVLHIHPSVSNVTEQTQTIVLGQTSSNTNNTLILPLAVSSIRESDSVVRAQNGQIVVIGGLMQNRMVEEIAGVPGVSKLPFVGALFRRTQQVAIKSELVILLRPVIVRNDIWRNTVGDSEHVLRQMKRGFHVGGLPGVFGNEGETEH